MKRHETRQGAVALLWQTPCTWQNRETSPPYPNALPRAALPLSRCSLSIPAVPRRLDTAAGCCEETMAWARQSPTSVHPLQACIPYKCASPTSVHPLQVCIPYKRASPTSVHPLQACIPYKCTCINSHWPAPMLSRPTLARARLRHSRHAAAGRRCVRHGEQRVCAAAAARVCPPLSSTLRLSSTLSSTLSSSTRTAFLDACEPASA